MAQERRRLRGGLAVAVFDARVGSRRKQALHFAHVAADHRPVKQRVAERALVIRIAGWHIRNCAALG